MKTRDLAMVGLFAALTAIGAWISIPIPPVPFTFQVLFVLLAGAVLGSARGGLSQIVYVLLGVIGLPVFAGGASGPGVLFGPTGGYIFGFIVAAFVVGALSGDEYMVATTALSDWRAQILKQKSEYPGPILQQMLRFQLKVKRELDDNLS